MELEDRLYSSSEVSRILGVSRRTLYRYLESGTLGSMHLPSGRHRFTKEQVEAFLVKTFGASSVKSESEKKNISTSLDVAEVVQTPVQRPSIFSKIKAQVTKESKLKEEIIEPVDTEMDQESIKEDIEEVEKAEDLMEEVVVEKVEDTIIASPVKEDVEEEEEVDEVVEDLKKTLSSLFDDSGEDEIKIEKKEKNNFVYYSSSISDLKKLAKTVKVASENSNVQYAFTGQAGASLFGEVSPFGQLHLYIRKNDMLFFEKRFDLQEVAEEDSNVALKVVDDLPEHTIVMGFKVVSLPILKLDLIQLGDSATASNLEG